MRPRLPAFGAAYQLMLSLEGRQFSSTHQVSEVMGPSSPTVIMVVSPMKPTMGFDGTVNSGGSVASENNTELGQQMADPNFAVQLIIIRYYLPYFMSSNLRKAKRRLEYV